MESIEEKIWVFKLYLKKIFSKIRNFFIFKRNYNTTYQSQPIYILPKFIVIVNSDFDFESINNRGFTIRKQENSKIYLNIRGNDELFDWFKNCRGVEEIRWPSEDDIKEDKEFERPYHKMTAK
jgi:hypothetical protein